MFNSNLT